MNNAAISMSVVIKGPDATAGSNFNLSSVTGIIMAIIGEIIMVSHKDKPTTKATE